MKLPKEAKAFFREAGRLGGLKGGSAGGKVAAEKMTKEQRVDRAKKAVAARVAKSAKKLESRK